MSEQKQHEQSKAEVEQTYVYPHAGIREREGRIPRWLLMVCIGLIMWSIYYTIRYWSEG